MTIWREQVSNEGHVYAAFERDLAVFEVEEAFEDELRMRTDDIAEEFAMEGGQ